jgi:hypothetical protein
MKNIMILWGVSCLTGVGVAACGGDNSPATPADASAEASSGASTGASRAAAGPAPAPAPLGPAPAQGTREADSRA